MKVLLNTFLALVICSISVSANADHKRNSVFYKKGKVIEVTPIYKTVTIKRPVYDCKHYSSSRNYHHKDALPTVIGATIGGVIGHKIFKKSRLKHAGTIAGAIVGGVIGNDIGTRHHSKGHKSNGHKKSRHHSQTNCGYETELVRKIVGYHVTYRYQGELFTARTINHPGKRIKLKIKVEVA